jgi:hypothetical protein
MEFSFNIEKLLGGVTKQGVAFISGENENKYSNEKLNNINILLDKVGKLSAKVRIVFINLIIILGSRIADTNNIWI